MNHQKENKLDRTLYKGMKTGVSSVMKTTGLDSGTSKHAAAVVINSALGLKPNNGTPSYTAPAPSVSVQVNSGNIAAGHGIRGKASVGQEPLRFQQKASIRTMSSPNASIELNFPVASKEHFRMQVGGSVKIEKNKKPEYRVGSEIKAEF